MAHFFPWTSLHPSRILFPPCWEHPGQAATAGRGNSPQRALLGQLMLDEFAFASYLPPLSAQTQRVAVPPSFHVPVPIDANSQEGGGGSFPELLITAHSLPAQPPAPHRPAVPRGERCWWRAHPTNLQEFWSVRGSHHGTGCLPNVPAGRLRPPAFPHPVSQVEKKNPSFGTHSDVLSARAISCRLPGGNKEVWFATTSPREHFGLVLSVSDGPSMPVWENRASLRGTRCRGAWWHPRGLVGMTGGLGCTMGLVGNQLE